MILSFLTWYLISIVVGLCAYPAVYKILKFLPDRGFSLARIFGLLLWGYIFWITNMLGILQNDLGSALFSLVMVLIISFLILGRHSWKELLHWLSLKYKLIITIELVFLFMFAFWAFIRAANPDVAYTEKPMELAFINSILRSPSFPPADPWLSGYAISYYYFGYLLAALISRVAGTPGGVTFNLAVSMWFALSGIAAFGLVFNLLHAWFQRQRRWISDVVIQAKAVGWSLLGPFFVLIVSNFEGFLEVLHRRGIFWRQNPDGTWTSGFWKWLDIVDLNQAPALPLSWIPSRANGGWTWWRASRVLQDYTAGGMPVEIIDEFPFFSFLLGDLHPHVLAIPFGLLAISIALNLYYGRNKSLPNRNILIWMKEPFFWTTAIVFGGMAFLNIWDFPIYVGIFGLAFIFTKIKDEGWNSRWVIDLLRVCFSIGLAGILLYLPFFVGFSSQAGGIIPSGVYATRGIHFWVMFGTLLIPILLWLMHLLRYNWKLKILRDGGLFTFWILTGLSALSFFIALVTVNVTRFEEWFLGKNWGESAPIQKLILWSRRFTFGDPNGISLIKESLLRRLESPGTWITLVILLILVWGLLSGYINRKENVKPKMTDEPSLPSPNPFVLLLVLAGAGLTLFPEFFYLLDQFGNRMNTIFKFYYQAWLFWGVAAAYASVIIWNAFRPRINGILKVLCLLLFIISLAYPIFMIPERTNSFKTDDWTLDGDVFLDRYLPDDAIAIKWLNQVEYGVIAEAVGPAYSGSGHARISVHTGLPTVLGWDNHERQWRGGSKEIGNRAADMQVLYETGDWGTTRGILKQYSIQYVYIGPLERSTYKVNDIKFHDHLKLIYQTQNVTIYEVPELNDGSGRVIP